MTVDEVVKIFPTDEFKPVVFEVDENYDYDRLYSDLTWKKTLQIYSNWEVDEIYPYVTYHGLRDYVEKFVRIYVKKENENAD